MEYIKAKKEDAEKIFDLVQGTIRTVYPKYYHAEVVDFFCSLHQKESVIADIEKGSVYVLLCDNRIIGTGTCIENHITRVFVNPEYQGRGHGSYIMEQLESEISKKYDTAQLDASLAACILYHHRGYKTVMHERVNLKNAILVYEIMEKSLLR